MIWTILAIAVGIVAIAAIVLGYAVLYGLDAADRREEQ